ncbi:MAG: cytochrome c biogenesis protein CcdA [Gemmatimonas sp.]
MALPELQQLLRAQPLVAIPVVFAGGVLTSLTPCIYPMIPITAAVIGGGTNVGQDAGSKPVRRRVVALTLSYVSGLAIVYAALGLVAGLSGTLFGGISTNPWSLIVMANLLLLFALMMLDVLPVLVPQALLQRAATTSAGGRIAGAFLMGAASGLVAAPCGAPVMATLLTWVAATHSGLLGFLYLFAFSLGMTSLLVVVGLASGGVLRLPRPGKWMVRVKQSFAVLMLGMAQYYLLQAGQVLV